MTSVFDALKPKPASAFAQQQQGSLKRRRAPQERTPGQLASQPETFTLLRADADTALAPFGWSWNWVSSAADSASEGAPAAAAKSAKTTDEASFLPPALPGDLTADSFSTETVASLIARNRPSSSAAAATVVVSPQPPPQQQQHQSSSAEAIPAGELRGWRGTVNVRRTPVTLVHAEHRWGLPTLPAGAASQQRRTYHLSPSATKSLMQKAVRRNLPQAAVRAAAALIRTDFVDFARRLPVVVFEDSICHPAIPAAVWLMLAASSKEAFVPSAAHIDLCLRIVWDIAACPFRDVAPSVAAECGPPPASLLASLRSGSQGEAIVKSLLARAAFGGMKCDVAFLEGLAHIWARRFLADEQGWLSLLSSAFSRGGSVAPIMALQGVVGALEPCDAILAAIDFHCSPVLDQLLASPKVSLPPGFTANDVKGAVWFFRSGVNAKAFIGAGWLEDKLRAHLSKEERSKQELQQLWEVIRAPLDDLSFRFLSEKYW